MEPKRVKIKAIDIIPYHYGLYCSIENGEPFVNDFVHRMWSESKRDTIIFMLDTHNFVQYRSHELVEVVPLDTSRNSESFLKNIIKSDREKMFPEKNNFEEERIEYVNEIGFTD